MGPESALPAEALGVLLERVAFGVLEGEADLSGVLTVRGAVGFLDAEGDALGVLDGVSVSEVSAAEVVGAEVVGDAVGVREGVGSATGSDVPDPHQENATLRQPPSPLPLASATEGIPTAPTATTMTAVRDIFRRFLFWRCLFIRDLTQWSDIGQESSAFPFS
ncbi:hypothetical protein GCM10023080_017940 [Streptomyces pseudoechinosporeus]